MVVVLPSLREESSRAPVDCDASAVQPRRQKAPSQNIQQRASSD
jgi:hypothetical protein